MFLPKAVQPFAATWAPRWGPPDQKDENTEIQENLILWFPMKSIMEKSLSIGVIFDATLSRRVMPTDTTMLDWPHNNVDTPHTTDKDGKCSTHG